MEVLRVTGFYGYGPASSAMRRNTMVLVEGLRGLGFKVLYEEIRVPALDYEEFEPFVKINEREIYIPSVSVDPEKLLDYVISVELAQDILLLPPPPLAVEA